MPALLADREITTLGKMRFAPKECLWQKPHHPEFASLKKDQMEKKEYYKHILPHFEQQGQAYFITWNLKDAVPHKALTRYKEKLHELKNQIEFHRNQNSTKQILENTTNEYRQVRKKYIKAYDNLLDSEKAPKINLSKPGNTEVIKNALLYWEGKKLGNFVFCVMPNHIHWVFQLFEKDENKEPVYLQDIL